MESIAKLWHVTIILMAFLHVVINLSMAWTDHSAEGARWARVPNPRDAGSNHYRVTLENSVFGVAILESRIFTAEPSDLFSFSYVVTTEPHRPLSNIQVCWASMDGRESVLADVLPDRNTPITEWKTVSLSIPVDKHTVGKIKVYGFCGNSELDTVAIDNLAVAQAGCSSSTMESSPMTTFTNDWQSTLSLIASSKASTSSFHTGSSSSTSLTTTSVTSTSSTLPTPPPGLNCPNQEDYSPCVCLPGDPEDPDKYNLICDGVSMGDMKEVFDRTTPAKFVYFKITTDDKTIPNNLMHLSRALFIVLNCMNGELDQIEPDAFRSSRYSLTTLEMINCGVRRVDFVFLTNFKLTELIFRNCSGLLTSWSSLPALSRLMLLTLDGLTQSNETISFPSGITTISTFAMINSDLNESSTNALMDWLALSFNERITYVTLSGNKMQAIPSQLNSLEALGLLQMNNNPLVTLESYALNVSNCLFEANFENCELEVVRPRFISDSFGPRMKLLMGKNHLTRMESSTFQPIFQRLYMSDGFADFFENPFDCADDVCHLAWIIRDHPEYLGGTVKNATCANGTSFEQLDPNWFHNECL